MHNLQISDLNPTLNPKSNPNLNLVKLCSAFCKLHRLTNCAHQYHNMAAVQWSSTASGL